MAELKAKTNSNKPKLNGGSRSPDARDDYLGNLRRVRRDTDQDVELEDFGLI